MATECPSAQPLAPHEQTPAWARHKGSVINYVIIYVTIRAPCNSGVLNNKEDQVFKCSLCHYFVVTIVVTVVPGPGSR